jgi:hypothetical protein
MIDAQEIAHPPEIAELLIKRFSGINPHRKALVSGRGPSQSVDIITRARAVALADWR